MNSLLPSSALTTRVRSGARASWVSALIVGTVLLAGCQDELPPPTSGTLSLVVSEETAGAATGAILYVDDVVWAQSMTSSTYDMVLPVGTHTIRAEKECTSFFPNSTMTVEVKAGGQERMGLHATTNEGLLVESTFPGARIFVDGEDTGRVTPATLCASAGTHTVALEFPGFAISDPQQIEVGASLATVSFDTQPVAQTRGAIVEVLTAVDCAFCLPVDEAAERIWNDPQRAEAGIVSVQLHHPWNRTDVLRTDETEARNGFYGFPPTNSGLPVTRTNGMFPTVGFPQGQTVETFYEAMLGRIEPFLTGDLQNPGVALHGFEGEFDSDTHVASGRVRVIALSDIADPASTQVIAMVYKNKLVTFSRQHRREVEFYRVVRDIEDLGTCSDLGIAQRGDWADVEIRSDLSGDTQWSEAEMGMIVLVQDLGTQEVLNVRHLHLK